MLRILELMDKGLIDAAIETEEPPPAAAKIAQATDEKQPHGTQFKLREKEHVVVHTEDEDAKAPGQTGQEEDGLCGYPSDPCPACRGTLYWHRPGSKEWICSRCHPDPADAG